jgi:hypothetical protein
MTSDEPPDGYEEKGEDVGRISDSEVPPQLDQVSGDENAVLFIPKGTYPPPEALNVKVVGVNPTTMRLIIARRC